MLTLALLRFFISCRRLGGNPPIRVDEVLSGLRELDRGVMIRGVELHRISSSVAASCSAERLPGRSVARPRRAKSRAILEWTRDDSRRARCSAFLNRDVRGDRERPFVSMTACHTLNDGPAVRPFCRRCSLHTM